MERTKVLDKTYMFNLLKGVAESAQKKVIQRPKAKWKKAFCKIRGCQVQIIWRGLCFSAAPTFKHFKGAGTRVYACSLHKEGAYGDNLHKGRPTD